MTIERLCLAPNGDDWLSFQLTDSIVDKYRLEEWAKGFSLMTAGYRDRLDPGDAANAGAAFNVVTVAIMAEAKARVYGSEGRSPGHVHVAGEVRPHTETFIQIASRIYAAHGITVHLRKGVKTTPIWYSSFGIFYREYESGDSFTASHSPSYKGGWKPLDGEGQQLLNEEPALIQEVKRIVAERATIRLATFASGGRIRTDFDVDEPYAEFQRGVVGTESLTRIQRAGARGFHAVAFPLGGSMKATTERIFRLLGIPTGPRGVVDYCLGDEDSNYHGVGQSDGVNHGPDPGKPEVYRRVGAQPLLLNGTASLAILWDPDGDRVNIVTVAPRGAAIEAREVGLEVEEFDGSEDAIVYFTPNQLYFMLTAFRLQDLRKQDANRERSWFVALSIATADAIEELAAAEGLAVVRVPVGFKHMGNLCRNIERSSGNVTIRDALNRPVSLGVEPRALILSEESGGASLGGANLVKSESGQKAMVALREKDGLQIALLALALGAELYESGGTFAGFYLDIVRGGKVRSVFSYRRDVRLYDESLMGSALEAAKAAGLAKRDRVVGFLTGLARESGSGTAPAKIQGSLEAAAARAGVKMPGLLDVQLAVDGVCIRGRGFRYLLRASGTDALLRHYFDGENEATLRSVEEVLTHLDV